MQIPRGKDYDNCKSALLFHGKNNINVTSFKGGTSDLLNFILVLYTVFERRLNKFQNYSFKGVIVKCEKECSAPKPIQSHNFDFLRTPQSSTVATSVFSSALLLLVQLIVALLLCFHETP